jgi:hypothetical protein
MHDTFIFKELLVEEVSGNLMPSEEFIRVFTLKISGTERVERRQWN